MLQESCTPCSKWSLSYFDIIHKIMKYFGDALMNFEKLAGMKLEEKDLEGVITEPVQRASSSFNISWLGSAGTTNSATVQQTDYNGKQLGIQVVVTGTPTWDVACFITVTPLNCELKSGAANVRIAIGGGNLGVTHLADITPKDSYKGTTVQFLVSITGTPDGVFYARGEIG